MRARVLSAGHQAASGGLTLADLKSGQRAIVIGYGDGVEPSAARRLFDLGLIPGVEVTMVRRAPLRDPVIYRVGDYASALSGAQSRSFHVEMTS